MELPLFSASKVTPVRSPQKNEVVPSQKSSYSPTPHSAITNSLSSIFPSQAEENRTSKTRRILGETAKTLSDAHIETIVAQFQYLIDSWMDEYERNIFNGQTLKKVINET